MDPGAVTVSIVSHRQNALVNQLLGDLARHCRTPLELVITQNVPDEVALATASASVIDNPFPRGFGANHNAAFARCETPYFCVANPDVRIGEDPFPALLGALAERGAAVAGPKVCSPGGDVEDSARRFPTAGSLVRKLYGRSPGPDYPVDRGRQKVDWIAGMFMLFRSEAYRAAGGFDERFFLYYEDVDLCRRLSGMGRSVLFEPGAAIVHDARRASRRNPRLMTIHAASALRYLLRRYPPGTP